MHVLNAAKLLDGIKKFPSVDEDFATVTMEGEYRANFDIFYRIMTAKEPGDIDDISFDEVYKQFSLAPDYWKHFNFEAKDRINEIKYKLEEVRPVVRRRIL